MQNLTKWAAFFLIMLSSLQGWAHSHHTTVYESKVEIVNHGHPYHNWNERVYVSHPWYHPDHVYYYEGYAYPNYYAGYPYYYYDPRFYYFQEPGLNINLNIH
jgi:hypothetical protein